MGSALATGDVDGDGKQEIFVGAGNRLVKLDGVERRVVGSAPLGAQVRCVDLVVADLTNAGAKEVICLAQASSGGSTTIKIFAAADLTPIVELPSAQYGDALAVGNVDNDPQLEIVTSGGYVFDGATFASQWAYAPGFGNDVAVGDVDGTGVGQIVATTTNALRGYSATAKSPLWELSMAGPFSVSSVVVRDIDQSSPAEIIAFTGRRISIGLSLQSGNAECADARVSTSQVKTSGRLGSALATSMATAHSNTCTRPARQGRAGCARRRGTQRRDRRV